MTPVCVKLRAFLLMYKLANGAQNQGLITNRTFVGKKAFAFISVLEKSSDK